MIKYLLKEYRVWKDIRRAFRMLRKRRKQEEAKRKAEWEKYWGGQF